MSRWKVIGEYLGRVVKITEMSARAPFLFAGIETSVVLLLLRAAMPHHSIRVLVKALVDQQPLVIAVHGIEARAAFQLLLAEVSDGSARKHIMTKVSEDDSVATAIEDLLHATWPSDDRFDDWTQYAIVIVGGTPEEVEAAVKQLCG